MLQTERASYLVVDEPKLEFGQSRGKDFPHEQDPQVGLAKYGPYSVQLGGRWHPTTTSIVPVAADDDFEQVADTLEQMSEFVRVKEPGTYARIDFPGFEAVYRSKLQVRRNLDGQVISRTVLDEALAERKVERGFKRLIEEIQQAVTSIAEQSEGGVVAMYLPKDIVTQFRTLTPTFQSFKPKKSKTRKDLPGQMVLFEDMVSERDDEREETLYQDLRRAIKVRAMQQGVSIQVLTDSFLTEDDSQPWAGKFWNVSCSLFCNAGGIPWRLPTEENIAHCGIRFGVSKDASGTRVLVGVAQVFSASGELVALRTGSASKGGRRKSETGYFLTAEQA